MTSSVDKIYIFNEEKLALRIEQIKKMLADNHVETGMYDMPFDPDYDRYLALAHSGDLAFFTVREFETNDIVGFALFFLDTEIQQKNIRSATQSLNFLSRGHRGNGYRFMKFCDDMLKKSGVNSVWRQSTVKFDIGKVYERMGYELVEKSYRRSL